MKPLLHGAAAVLSAETPPLRVALPLGVAGPKMALLMRICSGRIPKEPARGTPTIGAKTSSSASRSARERRRTEYRSRSTTPEKPAGCSRRRWSTSKNWSARSVQARLNSSQVAVGLRRVEGDELRRCFSQYAWVHRGHRG